MPWKTLKFQIDRRINHFCVDQLRLLLPKVQTKDHSETKSVLSMSFSFSGETAKRGGH